MRCLLRLLSLAVLIACLVPASAGAAGAGSTLLVSRPDGFTPVPPAFEGSSFPGDVSADGRYAVFTTGADGFADGVDPDVTNVMVRDTQTGTTTLVSRSDGAGGAGANADARTPSVAVSPAGHVLVAFATKATNLADHDTGPVTPPADQLEVWLRDVTAGTTTLVSRSGAGGPPADRDAQQPSIDATAGGPVVAFSSAATNLGGGHGGVFLRTVDAKATQVVSCRNRDCSGNPQGTDASEPDVRAVPSAAGTACAPPAHPGPCVLIAFAAFDRSVSGDAGNPQVVVAVASAPAASGSGSGAVDDFRLVSGTDATTHGNGFAVAPAIDSDGRAIAFLSSARNLTADTLTGFEEAFVHRLDTGTNALLSTKDAPADANTSAVDLGGDVNHLKAVFTSDATNLGGSGGSSRDYVRDVAAGRTSLLGTSAELSNGIPSISADGSAAEYTPFRFGADDDAPRDNFARVLVRRLAAPGQPVEVVSRPDGAGPPPLGSEGAFLPGSSAVSADGRYVAFASSSDGLADGARHGVENLYVRDLLTGHTVLASRADGVAGAGIDRDAEVGGISADGRKVVFATNARNLDPDASPGSSQVYMRDLDRGTTTLVSRADGTGGAPAKDGAFGGVVAGNGEAVLFSTSTPLDPAADDGQDHIYLRDLRAGTTTLVDRDSGAVGTVPATGSDSAAIDADGRHVAWSTRGAIAGAPADRATRVFVRDLRSRVTTLVSRVDGADGAPSAGGNSFDPSIDAAGDKVAFSSDAPNLGATARQQQVFVRDVGNGTTTLASRLPGTADLTQFTGPPAIDAAGDRVSFTAGSFSPPEGFGVYVRDLPSQTTEIASRADGADGAPDESTFAGGTSLTANGDCVAFEGKFAKLNDGFGSGDFSSVHMRVLRGECPAARPDAGPGPGDGEGAGDGPHTPPPPSLSALSVKPSRFWTSGARSGTTVRYKLSRAVPVTLFFDRLATGHRKGRHCLTKKARGPRCTKARRVGTLVLAGRTGANRKRFGGKLKGKRLSRGNYRVTARAGAAPGTSVRVVVVRAPRVTRR